MPETPAPPSLLQMRKMVAGYALMTDDPEALETALNGIWLAIDKINSRTWNWLVTDEDIIFDSAKIDYELSGNFKKPRRFMLCNSDGAAKNRLDYKDWQSFLNEHLDASTTASPCVYSVANVKEFGTLSLDCYPSTEFIATYPTGRIFYYRKCQRGTLDGAPDWPSEFTPFIFHYACGVTASIYSPQKSGMAYGLASDCWRDLVRDDNNTQTDWEK